MVKQMIKMIIMLAVFMCVELAPLRTYAQATQGLTNEEKAELTGTRKQLATIVFAGLAGAILGLSTLSFYGRPQEHLTNIAIGGAFGVIGGAIFTTYKAATQPYEAYDITQRQEPRPFENEERMAMLQKTQLHPAFGWSWTF